MDAMLAHQHRRHKARFVSAAASSIDHTARLQVEEARIESRYHLSGVTVTRPAPNAEGSGRSLLYAPFGQPHPLQDYLGEEQGKAPIELRRK
jgi:hypothetical protein